jgi:hypothetical protein
VKKFVCTLTRTRISLYVSVNLKAIRPVSLNGHEGEAVLTDESLAEFGTPGVKLMGAV